MAVPCIDCKAILDVPMGVAAVVHNVDPWRPRGYVSTRIVGVVDVVVLVLDDVVQSHPKKPDFDFERVNFLNGERV